MAQIVKNLPSVRETWSVSGSGRPGFDPWRREWLPTLAWRIPWTEEPGGLQPMGSQRVGHDLVTNTFTFLSLAHSVGGLFFLLMASFAFQKLLSLFRSRLFISVFFLYSLGDRPTKYCYDVCQRVFCLCFPLGVLCTSVALRSFLGVYGVCGLREHSAVRRLLPRPRLTLCSFTDCGCKLVSTVAQTVAQTRVHWVGDAIQPPYHIVSLCLSQADISYMVIASSFEMISSSSENSVSVWSLLFSWFSTVFKIQIFQIYLIGVIVERALLFLVHCILPGRSSMLSINILFSFCCCHHLFVALISVSEINLWVFCVKSFSGFDIMVISLRTFC